MIKRKCTYSYDAWMARADFAISLSRELYAKDAGLIKSVTGYALGTTLQEIYDVR